MHWSLLLIIARSWESILDDTSPQFDGNISDIICRLPSSLFTPIVIKRQNLGYSDSILIFKRQLQTLAKNSKSASQVVTMKIR